MFLMKVISGKYKGRTLLGYTLEGTRPTQDRVKESIFSMIQNALPEARVLDLFAGSGNLGIEALSHDAASCLFVDCSVEAIRTIENNIARLNVPKGGYELWKMDYRKALRRIREEQRKFDLVFLDPPYKMEIVGEVLKELVQEHLLTEEGLVICEAEVDHFSDIPGLCLIKEKKYGYKFVKIYQFEKEV